MSTRPCEVVTLKLTQKQNPAPAKVNGANTQEGSGNNGIGGTNNGASFTNTFIDNKIDDANTQGGSGTKNGIGGSRIGAEPKSASTCTDTRSGGKAEGATFTGSTFKDNGEINADTQGGSGKNGKGGDAIGSKFSNTKVTNNSKISTKTIGGSTD